MRMEFSPGRQGPCVLVLGMFDGVHMGHRQLISTAMGFSRRDGLPLTVCTFSKHPLQVLYPQKAPKLLSTLAERAQAMALLHVDKLCVLPFTSAVASETPEEFLTSLHRTFQPRHVVAGFNYTFGVRGEGNGDTLKAAQERFGFLVHVVPPVMEGGEPVSSTRIRGLLAQGRIESANRLMGRPYQIAGRVEAGKRLGRTMGFPTANLSLPAGKVIPAYGVYTAIMQVDGERLAAVVNVGRHPTLPQGPATIEAHLLGQERQLYGKKAAIHFLRFQREEKAFPTVDALKKQISADVREAARYFAEMA